MRLRKKTAKGKSKPKSTKPATKPSKAATVSEQLYGTHNEGSRKGKVHELFDKEGARGCLGPWAQTETERGHTAKLVCCVEATAGQQQSRGQHKLSYDT